MFPEDGGFVGTIYTATMQQILQILDKYLTEWEDSGRECKTYRKLYAYHTAWELIERLQPRTCRPGTYLHVVKHTADLEDMFKSQTYTAMFRRRRGGTITNEEALQDRAVIGVHLTNARQEIYRRATMN